LLKTWIKVFVRLDKSEISPSNKDSISSLVLENINNIIVYNMY